MTSGDNPIVPTPVFTTLAQRLDFATTQAAILAVYGPYGSGKTAAVRAALASQPHPHVFTTLPPGPSDKDIVRLLYTEVLKENDTFDLRDMQDALVDTLRDRSVIIALDDADELTAKSASQLHYLHTRPGATWTLVLVGGPSLGHAISTSARLRGDILASVHVRPLRGDTLIRTLRAVHPLYANADRALLEAINEQVCKGLMKRWMQFLRIALDLLERADRPDEAEVLDVKLAKATTALMPRLPVR
jgi:DNA transposition AAA+ family ATPase